MKENLFLDELIETIDEASEEDIKTRDFVASLLQKPVEDLQYLIDEKSQERFKCQHELLHQIQESSASFIDSIRLSSSFMHANQRQAETLKNLKNINQRFLEENSKADFIKFARSKMKTKLEFDGIRQSEAWHALTRVPRKLEDLLAVQRIKESYFEKTDALMPSQIEPAPDAYVKQQEAMKTRELLDKYMKQTMEKHFLPCLIKSIGFISPSDLGKKIPQLVPVWKTIEDIEYPEKYDTVFGFLCYRFGKNAIGKGYADINQVSNLKSILESLVSNTNQVSNLLSTLMQESRSPAEAEEETKERKHQAVRLSQGLVISMRDKIQFLVEKLVERGVYIDAIDSIFISTDLINEIKLKVFIKQSKETFALLRNILLSDAALQNVDLLTDLQTMVTSKTIDDAKDMSFKSQEGPSLRTLLRYLAVSTKQRLHHLQDKQLNETLRTSVLQEIDDLKDKLFKLHVFKTMIDKSAFSAFLLNLLPSA